jgi:hypothetical protein
MPHAREPHPARLRAFAPLAAAAVAVAALVPAAAGADQDVQRRLGELEARVQALTLRLEALESRATAPPPTPATASLTAEGIVWTFDDHVNGTPFKVTHKTIDKRSGRIDILLLITDALPDPAAWAVVGARVPLALTLRGGDGTEIAAGVTLARGPRLEPGAHLHVQAQVEPVQAAAARQIVVGREAE